MTPLPPVAQNPHWTGYRCLLCGREYGTDWDGFVCADCGADGILDVIYDEEAIRADLAAPAAGPDGPFPVDASYAPPAGRPDLWRFAPLLPLRPSGWHSCWSLGGTPLHRPAQLESVLGLAKLYLKDDTCLPSCSLKDRASAMALADAARLGVDHIACASTGNAAASMATLAARAGLRTTIFVPAAAPKAKLAQLELHGANVNRVDGTYDQAFDLSVAQIVEHRWYSRNCAYNPLLVEGKKTAGLELWLELGAAPDVVFVPTGDGCIVSSTAKAFLQLQAVGLIEKTPRVYGVQAAGAAPLADAWRRVVENGGDPAAMTGLEIQDAVAPVAPRTYADSISVGVPRNRLKAWSKVAQTGGGFLAVSDDEIRAAAKMMAAKAGVWAEPSGAAGFAGLMAAVESSVVSNGETVAVLVTGHGLKAA